MSKCLKLEDISISIETFSNEACCGEFYLFAQYENGKNDDKPNLFLMCQQVTDISCAISD